MVHRDGDDERASMIGDDFADALLRAQQRDPAAIEAIYRDLAPTVIGYLRISGSREPEDLAGEVFIDILRSLPRFRGAEASFRSWVFTIAHRRLVDEFRRRGRQSEDLTADLTDIVDLRNVENEAMTRLRAAGVLQAMAQLTDDQRDVLHLRIIADLPIADVAQILGKAETAIKALQRRALLRLRDLLAPEAETGGGTALPSTSDQEAR